MLPVFRNIMITGAGDREYGRDEGASGDRGLETGSHSHTLGMG